MKSTDVRKKFLDFFAEKGHTIVPSAPMVIKDDPTLMFTNAGMNQFKDIFLGNREPENPRVADSQKCLRVSGKHNDLEEVGVDTYHHTMFEMLGNWSFGDYYKKEAIDWAWELMTEVYGIDPERLYVTVFEGDSADGLPFDREAHDLWKRHMPENRIIAAGKKDNFWEMGDTGPCGPCSEIHMDLRPDHERAKSDGRDLVNADDPRVVEIWNLVFMELHRRADGSLVPLKKQHIDTGMGFERLCMALQNKTSTYDTDIFTGLIAFLEKKSGMKYGQSSTKSDIAFRVMADHVRAIAFAIADGLMPSNTGAGYVIRRILRRAVRYAYSFLNLQSPVMHELAEVLVSEMGDYFTELKRGKDLITAVIEEEEVAFLRTLSKGMDRISGIIRDTETDKVPGRVVFELYDTYGFPADLTALILSESGKDFDRKEFEQALEEQKQRSRQAGALDSGDWKVIAGEGTTEFVGYDRLAIEMNLLRYREVTHKGKKKYHLVFDRTPFYPEGGGQVGDRGVVKSPRGVLPIENTFRENTLIIHQTTVSPEGLGGEFEGAVDGEKRMDTARNHTATHLLHHALRTLLGTHVEQKGSLVDDAHLRFDFSHFAKVEPGDLRRLEEMVNADIRTNKMRDEKRDVPAAEALESGAIALFGEKYGDSVRVIRFGESIELCGGTHVEATGEIGFFKITAEGSVAAGIRRIEAITGRAAEKFIYDQLDTLDEIGKKLKSPGAPLAAIESLRTEVATLTKTVEQLNREKAAAVKKGLIEMAENIGGTNFIAAKVDLHPGAVKDLAFQLRAELSPLFLVLATAENDKATISVALSDELVTSKRLNANPIVKELSAFIRGGGGGQPFFATAGGKHPEGIEPALQRARELLVE